LGINSLAIAELDIKLTVLMICAKSYLTIDNKYRYYFYHSYFCRKSFN